MRILSQKYLGSAMWLMTLCGTLFVSGQEAVVILPESVPDPIEPFNRVMWGFNKALMTDVVKPTSRVYRFVVVKPVRKGIGNIGRNLTYPGRLINNLLQGKWGGARDESYLFACNTTVGVLGYFDMGTKWKIPKSDADFGQTFGHWGWQPHFFIMLPIFGPSNDRDTVGFAADTAANPLPYIAPYDFDANDPLTYLGPYTYFAYAVLYNDLSDSVDEYVRFSQAESDPYSEIQYSWTFARATQAAHFQVKGKTDEPSLQTIQSVFFACKDPEFPRRATTQSVRIPSTGRDLKFTYWLQPGLANVVYIVPGLGGHRLSQTSQALAELVYQNGFSAVVVSSPFNTEFMEHASTTALPAYLPVDGHDLHAALTEIDQRLRRMYQDRLGKKALMGYSMGALESLFIAASGPTNQLPLMTFDRYVAIDTPVRLIHGVSRLDEFYQAPLSWPETERVDNLKNTFLKVAALSRGALTPESPLPFEAIESQFLIGMNFHFVLRDMIYSSQQRNNQGVLHSALYDFRREPAYREIMRYSFHDYFEKFAVPYYSAQGLTAPVSAALENAGDLRTYSTSLRSNPDIRVIVNQNDFLLTGEDLAWLKETFPAGHLTVFEQGGHLGNFSNPDVQKRILESLADMKTGPRQSD